MSAVSDKIHLSFAWKGPSGKLPQWGSLYIGVIDLLFKNAVTEVSVRIPETASLDKKIPFTCRKLQGIFPQETHPDVLQLTVEQVQQLTLKAGVFEESSRRGPATMDRSGKITYQTSLIRSDRDIKLKIPEKLEVTQKYCLLITSEDLSLKAKIIEEQTSSVSPLTDTTPSVSDEAILSKILEKILLPLIREKALEFGTQLMKNTQSPSAIANFSRTENAATKAIQAEVKKIEKDKITAFMKIARTSGPSDEHKTSDAKSSLEDEFSKALLDMMEPYGFTNILNSVLRSLTEGSPSFSHPHKQMRLQQTLGEVLYNFHQNCKEAILEREII